MDTHKQNILESLQLVEAGLKPENYKSNRMRPRERMIYWLSCGIFYGGLTFIAIQLIKMIF